jgi:hypothetical protein
MKDELFQQLAANLTIVGRGYFLEGFEHGLERGCGKYSRIPISKRALQGSL